MGDFAAVMQTILQGFQIPITMYGFTFSFLDLMLWSVVVGLIVWFFKALLDFGG